MEVFIPITLFISVAAVAILRPISTKLGGLLEAMRHERTPSGKAADDPDVAHMRVLVEHLVKRIDLMEERMDFTERLLNGRRRDEPALPPRDRDQRSPASQLLRARDADPPRP
jgi:hypothetical protein